MFRENFGDKLSQVVAEELAATRGLTFARSTQVPRLLAVGSILHFAADGDTIWGTGRNGKISGDRHKFKNLDVRAVRGPLTRDFLLSRGIACPEIYGDPVLLLPKLFPDLRPRPNPEHDWVLVPNLNDRKRPDTENVVNPLWPWRKCVEMILNSKFVVSSSLHGIIIAEAFGIPVRAIRSDSEPSFKYLDYYLGTGRTDVTIPDSVAEARRLGGAPELKFESDRLLEAFPFDLWQQTADDRARGLARAA